MSANAFTQINLFVYNTQPPIFAADLSPQGHISPASLKVKRAIWNEILREIARIRSPLVCRVRGALTPGFCRDWTHPMPSSVRLGDEYSYNKYSPAVAHKGERARASCNWQKARRGWNGIACMQIGAGHYLRMSGSRLRQKIIDRRVVERDACTPSFSSIIFLFSPQLQLCMICDHITTAKT